MDVNSRVELPEARHGTTVTVANSAVLTVVPTGESVAVYGGETVDPAAELVGDAATQNQLVVDYVQRELNAAKPKQQVILCAAKQVKYREVARLLSAVGQVPGAKVYLAVIEASP
jgi:biopolymer transport protein ExbD